MVHKMYIKEVATVSRFKCVLSQVLACLSSNILLLDLGMSISFPTIALPDLLNSPTGLSLNEYQASWFGSIAFLTQPIGALFSGPIVDYFGRKNAVFLVNIPHLVAWILIYFAWNVPILFFANALIGLGTGVMESPINVYVGEVSEPALRGTLCTTLQLFMSVGIFLMYIIGGLVHWRYAALFCMAAPIASMLLVVCKLVPETPAWLLVKNREKEAMKSLCFLRGWTSPENVREEFNQLAAYSKDLNSCVICYNTENNRPPNCEHSRMNIIKRMILKFRYLMLTKETLRPFIFISLYFGFYVITGLYPFKPNLINVCGAFGMAADGNTITLVIGVITVVMSVVVILLIKVTGKRKLAISAMLSTAVLSAALSGYAKMNLDDTVFSYDVETFPKETSYVPLILLYLLALVSGLGLPWIMLGEIFPFRSRASAQGFAAALNYVFAFISTKTFIDLELSVNLWGSFAVYAFIGFIGTIFLYIFMPETEGKSLQDIQNDYSGDFKIFADDFVINYFRRKIN